MDKNGSLIGTGQVMCRGYMAKYLPRGFMAYLEIDFLKFEPT